VTALKPYRPKSTHAPAIFLILLAVFFSFSAFRGLFGVREVLISAIYPFQYAAVSVWGGVASVPAGVTNLIYLSRQNFELKKEVEILRAQQLVLDGLQKENERLRSALSLPPFGGRFRLLAAQVVGRSPAPWFPLFQINQGSRAGVRQNMPVVVRSGLVGKVVEVSPFSAKVMALTDPDSLVAAVDARSRDAGIVAGSGSGRLFMRYVSIGADVAPGDSIVTASLSTVFPAGLPVGQVTRAERKGQELFYVIEVKPAVNFSRLEEVFVVL
jgi:rod shape-determining protein MreC